jgi:hypothetical protein
MKTWNERLVYAMNERGAIAADLMRVTKCKSPSVSGWTTGDTKSINGDNATKVVNYLGITSNWLFFGKLPSGLPSIDGDKSTLQASGGYFENGNNQQIINQFDAPLSITNGITQLHASNQWLKDNLKNLTSINNIALITGFDDSMKGLFKNGDPIIIDAGITEFNSEGPYFFKVDNKPFIRHLQKVPGVGLMAIAENKIYQSFAINENMDFEIYGRIMRTFSSTDF